jgi:hypothetical protein
MYVMYKIRMIILLWLLAEFLVFMLLQLNQVNNQDGVIMMSQLYRRVFNLKGTLTRKKCVKRACRGGCIWTSI